MPDTWISEEMRAAIGGVHSDRRSMPISVSDIRKWAQAVYYPEPPPREYWDEEYAATTPAGGIVAPEEFNPFAWMTASGPPAQESLGQGASTTERRLGVDPPATSQHAERRHGGRVHGRPHATRRRDPRRHHVSATTPNAKDASASCSSPPPNNAGPTKTAS